MGWCSEFGIEIAACDHPMVAGEAACHCEMCGTRCEGRFEGCPEVWAGGPVPVELKRRGAVRATHNGSRAGIAGASHADDGAGITEVREALQRLEARLNILEMNTLRLLDALVAPDVSINGAVTSAGSRPGDPRPTT